MTFGDTVNSCFEGGLGLMVWLNVRRLVKDKQVKGISLWTSLFVTTWGYWNCYYYPSLGQWLSFTGGVMLAVANTVWLALAVYYLLQECPYDVTAEEIGYLPNPEREAYLNACAEASKAAEQRGKEWVTTNQGM